MVNHERFDAASGSGRHLAFRDTDVPPRASPFVRGDQYFFVAQLAPLRLFRNKELMSPWPRALVRGVFLSGSALALERRAHGEGLFARIDQARGWVRDRIRKTYSPLVVGLGRALVLGENDLGEEDYAAFQQSGLMHLLAVSGTHLVIAILSTTQLMRHFLVRIPFLVRRYDVSRWCCFFGAFLSLLYADFSGGSGSAWRAAWMLCLLLGMRAFGRKINARHALAGSVIFAGKR